jgi:hypothetical protein
MIYLQNCAFILEKNMKILSDISFKKTAKIIVLSKNRRRSPFKPRVFDALGRLGGADSAPLFYFCSVQHRAMKLGMCIVHHEMNPKMQSIFSYDT